MRSVNCYHSKKEGKGNKSAHCINQCMAFRGCTKHHEALIANLCCLVLSSIQLLCICLTLCLLVLCCHWRLVRESQSTFADCKTEVPANVTTAHYSNSLHLFPPPVLCLTMSLIDFDCMIFFLTLTI